LRNRILYSLVFTLLAANGLCQFHDKNEFGYIDRIPISINSRLYLDSSFADGSIGIVASRIRIHALSFDSAVLRERFITLREEYDPVSLNDYQFRIGSTGFFSTWKQMYKEDLLIDTTLLLGQLFDLEFRNARTLATVQKTTFRRHLLTPAVLGFQLSVQRDTGLLESAARNFKRLDGIIKGFVKFTGKVITIPAGHLLTLQINKVNESIDSCIEYRIRDYSGMLVSDWRMTGHFLNLDKLRTNKSYQLELRYVENSLYSTIQLQTLSHWFEIPLNQFLIAGLFIVIALATYVLIRRKIKRRVFREHVLTGERLKNEQNKLNRHFIFNALATIESLIINNQNADATRYLHQLALMLRNALKYGELPLITLAQELELIEIYVSIEQLRHKFRIQYSIDPTINMKAVMFPPMLLQPTIENSIKHGVGRLGIDGLISVHIKQTNTDLLITVLDNGTSIKNGSWEKPNHGMSITRERINHLQNLNPDVELRYECSQSVKGTVVQFIFKNWIESV
jgi:hypothetical protein